MFLGWISFSSASSDLLPLPWLIATKTVPATAWNVQPPTMFVTQVWFLMKIWKGWNQNFEKWLTRNTNWKGRLSTVDLLIKVAHFVTKDNNSFRIKLSLSKVVSTRRSTVLSLPLQRGFAVLTMTKTDQPEQTFHQSYRTSLFVRQNKLHRFSLATFFNLA